MNETRLALSVMRGARQVATMVDLRALNGIRGETVALLGYYTASDGGGGVFYWDHASTSGENGGTIIVPASPRGRWRRLMTGFDHHAKWFGAVADGVTDDAAAIQSCFDAAALAGPPWVVLPATECAVGTMIKIGARGATPTTDNLSGVRITGARSLDATTRSVLKWIGSVGGTIMRVRNASGAILDGVGFNGAARAAHCIQVTHVVGDSSICSNVRLSNGFTVDATVADVLVGEASGTSYGDCSGLLLDSFYCHGASADNEPIANILVTAQYTFGIVLNGTRLASSEAGFPSANIRMYGGSLIMVGGALDIAGDASVVLEGHPDDPLVPFPSITLDTVECQSGNMLLRTAFMSWNPTWGLDGTHAAPLRGVTIRNCLHSDIIGAVSATSIYWDVPGFATLCIDGGTRLIGDVELAQADAKVAVDGAFFAEGKGFTGAGAGRVAGSWLAASGLLGVWKHRMPNLATYADDTAAGVGGLTAGDIYKTAAGAVMVKL